MIIRWVCEKDNKKWLYPVNKCIYCKKPTKKQISRKAKIVGMTKVNIPSPLHPIVPYNIILLEDEHKNRVPKKTMRDYKIGDEFEAQPAKTNGAVVIVKTKYDIKEYVKEALRLLDSFDINREDKVIIKPSIIEPAYEYQSITTSANVLDALISFLREKGVNDIIVGEQAMLGNDVISAAEKCGILDICKKQNIKFIDLSKSDYVDREFDGKKFRIAKEVVERKLINVPVMKTHSQIVVAGALENLIRVVDKDTQLRMHADDIEETLPVLAKTLGNFLTLGDAIIGLQGEGPTLLGEPAFLNLIFVSKDPVALDSSFAEMGMLKKPRYLYKAADLGVGIGDTRKVEFVDNELESLKFPMKAAGAGITANPHIKLIDGKSDPCTFNSAHQISAKLFGLAGHDLHLAIGSYITEEMLSGNDRIVAYGDDAIKKLKELNAKIAGEIKEDIDDVEKIVLIKGLLVSEEKKSISAADKIKSKVAKFGMKLKRTFS